MDFVRALALACLLCGACSGGRAATSAYDGTVVVGTDYVQVLATAPDDKGCRPRVHRAGVCVRSSDRAACASAPACIAEVTVRGPDGQVIAEAKSAFVKVPALPPTIAVTIRGCGGTLTSRLDLEPAVAPFDTASAQLSADTLDTSWRPVDPAIQVCALATGPGFREVCCTEDVGVASFPITDLGQVTGARLSRGRLLHRAKTRTGVVEYYRTADTANLLR